MLVVLISKRIEINGLEKRERREILIISGPLASPLALRLNTNPFRIKSFARPDH
jgi:hypothetical protein